MIEQSVGAAVTEYCGAENTADWNIEGLLAKFGGWLCVASDFTDEKLAEMTHESLTELLMARANKLYEDKATILGSEELARELDRVKLLHNVDTKWIDHLEAMEDLKSGVSLNAYAQRNPLTEYRIQGADMFDAMIDDIRESTVRDILTFFPAPKREVKIVRQQVAKPLVEGFDGGKPTPKRAAAQKVGRNDLCPCGSGKKYKKCCGADKD